MRASELFPLGRGETVEFNVSRASHNRGGRMHSFRGHDSWVAKAKELTSRSRHAFVFLRSSGSKTLRIGGQNQQSKGFLVVRLRPLSARQ